MTDAFGQIGYAVADLKRPQDVVSVKAVPTFAIRWLLPRLAEFQRPHPGIKLEVATAWHGVDLDREDFDCGISGCGQPTPKAALHLGRARAGSDPAGLHAGICAQDGGAAHGRGFRPPHPAASERRTDPIGGCWMEGWGGGPLRRVGRPDLRDHRPGDPRRRVRPGRRDR